MIISRSLFIITIYIVITVVFGTRDEFTCHLNDETNVCWFKNLARNVSEPRFVARSDIPNENVTKVYLGGGHGSHIHTLTQDICLSFPHLKDYNGQLLYLHEVQSDAFNLCSELEVVNLEVNRLEKLDVNLFRNNQNLKKVQLGDNLLQSIDLQMFEGLTALEELDLNKNLLKTFSVHDMPKLPELHLLFLHNNLLTELDIQKLYEKCPKMTQTQAILRLCPGNRFEKTEDPKFNC